MVRLSIVAFLLALSAATSACAEDTSVSQPADSTDEAVEGVPVGNFFEVRPGLYRGARPNAEGLRYLKEQVGIRTIISLELPDYIEATPAAVAEEKAAAEKVGLVFEHEPITSFDPARGEAFNARIEEILRIMRDPSAGPIYVHCRHGKDRTGLVIGLERVLVEGWTPQAAYREMVERGFRRYFINLLDYFVKKTNSDDV